MVGLSNCMWAQATVPGNNSGNPNDYLGWDTNTTFDLNIEHRDDGPLINFLTNGSRRMMIESGGSGVLRGYIGMGNSLGGAFSPQQRLHLHHSNNFQDILLRWSNGSITGSLNNGLDIGLLANSDDAVIFNGINSPIRISP